MISLKSILWQLAGMPQYCIIFYADEEEEEEL
jgi:hypothetical protein